MSVFTAYLNDNAQTQPASTVGRVIICSRRPGYSWLQSTSPVHTKNESREQNHALFRGDLSSLWPDLI